MYFEYSGLVMLETIRIFCCGSVTRAEDWNF
jgi:hypothetical protein